MLLQDDNQILSKENNSQDGTPKGFRTTLVVFFILGIGSLLPWYSFINKANYYQSRFCDASYEYSFESFFAMIYTASQPAGLLLTIYLNRSLSLQYLILYPLVIYTCLFILITTLVTVTNISSDVLFGITLSCVFICGICASFITGGLFGLSSIFPSYYTTSALMNGESIAGFVVSLATLILNAITGIDQHCDNDDDTLATDDGHCGGGYVFDEGAFIFYLIATIALLVCTFLFVYLLNIPYVCHFLAYNLQISKRTGTDNPPSTDNTNVNPIFTDLSHAVHNRDYGTHPDNVTPIITPAASTTLSKHSTSADAIALLPLQQSISLQLSVSVADEIPFSPKEIFQVIQEIRVPAAAICLTYAATLTVYPALLVLILPYQIECEASSNSRSYYSLFVSILFVVYSGTEFFGRFVANFTFFQKYITASNIWLFAVGRCIFPLGLFFCNIGSNHLPILFPYDELCFLLTIGLGFSNGLLANLNMIYGPKLVSDPKYQPVAGNIMIFCIASGLLIGSCVSFLSVYIVLNS